MVLTCNEKRVRMTIRSSIRNYVYACLLENFARTRYGNRLKRLKGIHAGRRCFIIGNGPSLTPDDLTRLKEKQEITFAFNRIYAIFGQTSWRPTYYICQDEKMLKGSVPEVCQLPAQRKFIPIQLKWFEGIEVPGADYFNLQASKVFDDPSFSEDIARRVYNSRTVVYTAIQMAAYMGISEMYLIGVDHHFRTSVNAQGEIVIDPTAKDYFTESYNADQDHLYIPNTDKSTLTYLAAKKYADREAWNVYNATRGGQLEVFQRVDLDTLW